MWHDQLYVRRGLEQQHHTQSGSMETLITDSLTDYYGTLKIFTLSPTRSMAFTEPNVRSIK